jgi:hypothetical protein
VKYKDILELSIDWKVYNEKFVTFWLDRWFNNTTLTNAYPYLFSIASENKLSITFNRQLVGIFYTEWCDLNL